MRFWIEYLSTNAQAFQDFENYFVGIEVSLKRELMKAINERQGKDKVYEISVEMEVYNRIKQKLITEVREKQSEIAFQEARKEQ